MGGGRARGRARRAAERQLRPELTRSVGIVRAVVASARKEPKSKYTADRGMPGAFEGETVTRRRFMTLTAHGAGALAAAAFTLPPLAFAVGTAIFERPPVRWEAVGTTAGLPQRHLRAQGDHDDDRHRRGRQDHGLHARAQRRDRPGAEPAGLRRAVRRRSRRAACTSAARCATCRPRSASSARATAASTTSRAWSPAARRCARSTASTRACATATSRSGRATRSTRSSSASTPTAIPAQPLDGIGQYLYPPRFSTPKQ